MSQRPKKVLHITNWYPNTTKPMEAIWLAKHIRALGPHCENTVWHLAVKGNQKTAEKFFYKDEEGVEHRIRHTKIRRWFFIEWMTFWMLLKLFLFKIRQKDYDIINIHIAYPLCTYLHLLRPFIKLPIVITEHWSAYRLNFNIKNPKKLRRIKRIFKAKIPLITVSKALGNDIYKFSDQAEFDRFVVPNIVDHQQFFYDAAAKKVETTFFMVSQWQPPKQPLIALEAFHAIWKKYPLIRLRIAGFGAQEPAILEKIKALDMTSAVTYMGKILPTQVAKEMQQATAYVHCSDYETFSVVCAEAISCGTPVIASPVGGIVEFIHDKNGCFATENTVDAWIIAFQNFLERYSSGHHFLDLEAIAEEAHQRFTTTHVGSLYYETLSKIYNEAQK